MNADLGTIQPKSKPFHNSSLFKIMASVDKDRQTARVKQFSRNLSRLETDIQLNQDLQGITLSPMKVPPKLRPVNFHVTQRNNTRSQLQ